MGGFEPKAYRRRLLTRRRNTAELGPTPPRSTSSSAACHRWRLGPTRAWCGPSPKKIAQKPSGKTKHTLRFPARCVQGKWYNAYLSLSLPQISGDAGRNLHHKHAPQILRCPCLRRWLGLTIADATIWVASKSMKFLHYHHSPDAGNPLRSVRPCTGWLNSSPMPYRPRGKFRSNQAEAFLLSCPRSHGIFLIIEAVLRTMGHHASGRAVTTDRSPMPLWPDHGTGLACCTSKIHESTAFWESSVFSINIRSSSNHSLPCASRQLLLYPISPSSAHSSRQRSRRLYLYLLYGDSPRAYQKLRPRNTRSSTRVRFARNAANAAPIRMSFRSLGHDLRCFRLSIGPPALVCRGIPLLPSLTWPGQSDFCEKTSFRI